MMESSVARILRMIADDDELKVDSAFRLREDLNFDSLKVLKLIVHIEKEFNFILSEEELYSDSFDTVDGVVKLLARKKEEAENFRS